MISPEQKHDSVFNVKCTVEVATAEVVTNLVMYVIFLCVAHAIHVGGVVMLYFLFLTVLL